MYIDENIKIDKSVLPTQLAEEVEMMDNLYYDGNDCAYYLKLNEIYAMAKTALLNNMIDGITCKNIWERYGVCCESN